MPQSFVISILEIVAPTAIAVVFIIALDQRLPS
jgi:hypothetical protein